MNPKTYKVGEKEKGEEGREGKREGGWKEGRKETEILIGEEQMVKTHQNPSITASGDMPSLF